MVDTNARPANQSPLSPAAFSILMALKDSDLHGYAILRVVSELTHGEVKLLPGTLYNLLKRMLEDGWIQESDERPDPALDDERRRYYSLTGLGERVVRAEARRLEGLVRIARQSGLLASEEA